MEMQKPKSIAKVSRRDRTEAGVMARRAGSKAQPSARYEQRRLEVLRAAARTFNRKGFQTATLDDVADDLGVTKPAIYYYAKSKDELLIACAQMALEDLEQALAATTELPAADRLRRFFERYAAIICEDFGRCLVMIEPRHLAPKVRRINTAGRRELNRGVREIIRQAIADGAYRPCDDMALASAMFDAINGLAKWFNPKGPTPLTKMIDRYFDIFLHGVASKESGGK